MTTLARALLLFVASLGASVASSAQELDIGGIAVRIGTPVADALRDLSGYRVQFAQATGMWFVEQQIGQRWHTLGWFSAHDGRVQHITKVFSLEPTEQTATVYSSARVELQRRGGGECMLQELDYGTGAIGFKSVCGNYSLVYTFPTRVEGQPVPPGLSLSVGSVAVRETP